MSLRFLIALLSSSQQSGLSEEHPDQPGLRAHPLCCLPGKHADFISTTQEENPCEGREKKSDEPLKSCWQLSSVSHFMLRTIFFFFFCFSGFDGRKQHTSIHYCFHRKSRPELPGQRHPRGDEWSDGAWKQQRQ